MMRKISSVGDGWYNIKHPSGDRWQYMGNGNFLLWVKVIKGEIVDAIGSDNRPNILDGYDEYFADWRTSVAPYGSLEDLLAESLGLLPENDWDDELILEL